MEIINNCDELLEHLYSSYGTSKYCCGGYIKFQDRLYEIKGFMPDKWCNLMPSSKFPKTVFSVQCIDEKYFMLGIFKGDVFVLDETLGIKLPIEIKDEIVFAIQYHN